MTALAATFAIAFGIAAATAIVLAVILASERRAADGLAVAAQRLARGDCDAPIRRELPLPGPVGRVEDALDDLRDRLRETVARLEGWRRGDLAPTGPRSPDDRLGHALDHTARHVAATLAATASAGERVSATARGIFQDVRAVRQAAHAHSTGTEETATTMEEIASQIQSVAKNAEHIAAHVGQTAAALESMVASNDQVARSGEALLRAVEDTSLTMETVATSVVSVADTAGSLSRVAQQVAAEASAGNGLLDASAHKLTGASERTEQSSAVIERLGEQSREIGSIIKVIEAIADQTNLLALNAAIEAARAGDAGRGFAVVADEVRKLAERSMQATGEIRSVIEAVQQDNAAAVQAARNILADIRDAVQQVVHTGGVLTGILRSIEQVSAQVKDVQQATQEQSFAASEVMKLVANMNDVAHRVVEATREQATTSRKVLDSAQAITVMTQQVADATAQQKLAGDQILSALEHISQVATENLTTLDRLGEGAGALVREAEALAPIASPPAPLAWRPAPNGEQSRRLGDDP